MQIKDEQGYTMDFCKIVLLQTGEGKTNCSNQALKTYQHDGDESRYARRAKKLLVKSADALLRAEQGTNEVRVQKICSHFSRMTPSWLGKRQMRGRMRIGRLS